jgi:hypothetical protein
MGVYCKNIAHIGDHHGCMCVGETEGGRQGEGAEGEGERERGREVERDSERERAKENIVAASPGPYMRITVFLGETQACSFTHGFYTWPKPVLLHMENNKHVLRCMSSSGVCLHTPHFNNMNDGRHLIHKAGVAVVFDVIALDQVFQAKHAHALLIPALKLLLRDLNHADLQKDKIPFVDALCSGHTIQRAFYRFIFPKFYEN